MLRVSNLSLGDLEMGVLECLWHIGDGNVRDVHALISAKRFVTSNTVQSALERMHRKALLSRRKVSHSFVYRAAISRSDLLGLAVDSVIAMTRSGAGDVLTAFVDFAARPDVGALDELERLLAERISEARGA